jgi:uncharacterized membrane protein YbhN (UPF0104 family)
VTVLIASVDGTVHEFAQSAGQFFKTLGELQPLDLLIGLACFALYILFRSRAIFNAVRAAYPQSSIPWRRVWGAYVAAYGLNGIVPAAGGNVVQLVLTKTSIEESSYPTVTSALCVPALFDIAVATCLLLYAFTNAHFPGLKDFGGLESFDISFLASNPSLTLFLVTLSGVVGVAAFALLSRRIALLWVHMRQGWAILRDRRRYVTSMLVPQTIGWVFRFAAYYAMLAAFHVGATIENAALVLAVQVVAAIVPFTPGGAGVQQALLIVIFGSRGPTDAIAVFSVGQQIAFVVLTLTMGFAAITFIFGYRSFSEVLRESRARRKADARIADRDAVSVQAAIRPLGVAAEDVPVTSLRANAEADGP